MGQGFDRIDIMLSDSGGHVQTLPRPSNDTLICGFRGVRSTFQQNVAEIMLTRCRASVSSTNLLFEQILQVAIWFSHFGFNPYTAISIHPHRVPRGRGGCCVLGVHSAEGHQAHHILPLQVRDHGLWAQLILFQVSCLEN